MTAPLKAIDGTADLPALMTDLATEARLRQALRRVTRDATVLIVAQRVSTIKDADQIVVLEHGAVVGLGTHESLLATCETYVEIVESQQMLQVG